MQKTWMAAASIELRFLKAARNPPGFEEVGLKEMK
jgi:hypothetical protein